MFGRKKVAMLVAEFLGTYALASAVLAAVSRTTFPFFGAATAGLTLAVMVLVIGAASGAHINPAVTLGLWSIRKVPTMQALAYIIVQLAAGMAAFRVNQYMIGEALPNLAKSQWDWKVFTAELIGTLVFSFGIAAAVYSVYEGGKLAAAIGGSLFVGVLVASFGANGILNPAVAAGLNSWSAAYALGPLVGAVLGMNLYAQIFAPQPAASRAKAITRKK
jgi:glycerol uptake facilitator-like aquaporin